MSIIHNLHDTELISYLNKQHDVFVSMEAVIDSIPQAILEFISKNINGFVELSGSFEDYQKNNLNHINQAVNRLTELYKDKQNYKDIEINIDIPEFHDFKVLIQSLFYLSKITFSDALQKVVSKESLFGLMDNKYINNYSDVFESKFTSELQSKLGLVYEYNKEDENDATKGQSNVETLRFIAPLRTEFQANSHGKSVERLGYGDIGEIHKFTKTFNSVILSITEDLPKLVDRCKSAKLVAEKELANKKEELTEEDASKIVGTAVIWGHVTDSCIKALLFYTRAYLEIINAIYQSIAK